MYHGVYVEVREQLARSGFYRLIQVTGVDYRHLYPMSYPTDSHNKCNLNK